MIKLEQITAQKIFRIQHAIVRETRAEYADREAGLLDLAADHALERAYLTRTYFKYHHSLNFGVRYAN